ncbi:MAG: sodium:solute symporter family protein [Desulfitobacteriaceae bacterium]|nr:sodium:solute symporter family protein [Desulfitobacteriaceae bacterium]
MSIQLGIIILYFVITILVGLYAKKKSTSSASFHGAGLGVLMCVAAGTGEWLGGTSTVGIAEFGFTHGISGAWYSIANGLGVIVLAIFFAELYRSLDTITVPGIVEKFIGVNARVVASVLLTFVMIAVGTAQIIAAGTLGVSILGLDFNTAVIILGIGFIIYTLAGGMNSVAYTNVMHLFCMYGGMILALLFVSHSLGGLSTLAAELPADPYFKVGGIGWPKVSSWVIASVLGACTAQAGIQPILAAKDTKTAKKAAFATALVVAPFGILTALLGMAAKVSFPELTNAKMALPTLMMNLNPIVGGIVMAALFAAILSTICPLILASGTMFTKDIYQRVFKPQASDQEVLSVSRLTTGLAGVICIVLAILFYGGTTILDMVYFAYSIRGALFVVLLYAIYWKYTSRRGAVWAMIVTGAVGLFWVAFKAQTGSFPISPEFTETYAAVITAVISTVVFSLVLPDNGGRTPRESS